jgi:nucleotide-binding universal stress UspA family protein
MHMEAAANFVGKRILLAVDQSGSSRGASEEAISLALDEHAALIVLSVVEQHNLHLPGGLRRRVDQERDRLESGAMEIVRRARERGVQATFLIWEGEPAEAILEASRAEQANTIVLGSRPRTNLRRLVLGSVSSQVAKLATCDVVVVPA